MLLNVFLFSDESGSDSETMSSTSSSCSSLSDLVTELVSESEKRHSIDNQTALPLRNSFHSSGYSRALSAFTITSVGVKDAGNAFDFNSNNLNKKGLLKLSPIAIFVLVINCSLNLLIFDIS